jgi:hypothetical protein
VERELIRGPGGSGRGGKKIIVEYWRIGLAVTEWKWRRKKDKQRQC